MTALQLRVVTICFLEHARRARHPVVRERQLTLSRDWGIDRRPMGAVGSAVLVGMMAGSIVTAPFADAIGRARC